jgi:hypothetical protein
MLRDWTDSDAVNALSAGAETLFVRLIMKADDYGCFHGNPALVRSFCFPLKETMRNTEISRWLDELQAAGIIAVYTHETDGKTYLQIKNFKQRLKQSRHRFPMPPGGDNGDQTDTSGNFPEQNKNKKTEGEEIERDNCACAYADDAMRIANLYPPQRKGNWHDVVSAISKAIEREYDRGNSHQEAIAKIENATKEYAEMVKANQFECLLYNGENFYNKGVYNNSPELWKISNGNTKEKKGMKDDSSYSYTSKLG